MQRLADINEAVAYLNDGDIITSNGKDQIVMKEKKIYRYDGGTKYSLDLKDFVELYRATNFYLYEEPFMIDEKKDEEYYRYYKK